MKKLLPVLLVLLVFLSCKKAGYYSGQFSGTWEYENFSGYPFNNNYLPPGNGKIFVLSGNGSFERRQHDTVLFKGKYYLKEQKDCYGEEKKVHFTTNDPGFSVDSYIEIIDGKLTLSSPNCYQDGGTSYYHRIL